jgi:ribose transport system substrate-binding protein
MGNTERRRSLNRIRLTQVTGLVALVVLLAALVTGCGGSSDSSTSSGSTESSESSEGGSGEGSDSKVVAEAKVVVEKALKPPTEIKQTTPLKEKPPANKTVAYLEETNPGSVLCGVGVEEAAKAVGWNFLKVSYSVAEPASIQAAAKTALQKGADYILIEGAPANLLGQGVLDEIKNAGVKVANASIYPPENTDTVSSDAAAGEAESGRLLANWFIAESNGEGNALVSTVAAYPVLLQFAKEFVSEVEEKCPNCTANIAEFSPSDLEKGAIVPTLVNKLRSDSSIEYLFFDYAAFGTGIDSAMKAAGVTGVEVGGTGSEPESIAELKHGTQAVWVGDSWLYQGYTLIDRALRWATNSPGSEENRAQPLMLLTQQSIEEPGVFESEGNYNAPLNALEQFEKLWQVG